MPQVGNESNHTMDGLTIRGGLGIVGAAGATAYLDRDAAADVARSNALRRGQGIYAETTPLGGCNASIAGVSQSVYANAVGLLAGDVVSSITVLAIVVSTTATLVKVGLATSAGVMLGQSASVHGAFNSPAGMVTSALTAPYTVLTDGLYYPHILQVAATGATLICGRASMALGNGAIGAGSPLTGIWTGQADLPANGSSLTLSTATTCRTVWFGIS